MPSRRRGGAALVLLLLGAAGSAAAERIERVLAVVDDIPVLLSETRALERVKGFDRDAALQELIDELLMLREASRLREAAPSAEEEERAYRSLLEKLPPAMRTDVEALRRIAWRQSVILKYIELRFRPQIRVDEAELQQAYTAEYGARPDAPPLAQVSAQLLERLEAQALDKRIESWVEELRAGARVRVNPEPPQS